MELRQSICKLNKQTRSKNSTNSFLSCRVNTEQTIFRILTVIKKCPKPCSTIALISENMFNLFDYSGNPAFRNFVTSENNDFVKFLAKHRTLSCLL